MAKRQARRRLLPAALSLGLLVSAVLTVALGAPAGADVVPPPSGSLPAGQWIAFAISPTNPVSGQQVTLSVAGSSGVGPADLWGPGGWPGSWNADGITLDQPTPCPDTASSCSYTIGGSSSGPFVFGINLANNLTPQQIQNLQQSIGVQQPPTTTTTTSPPVTAPPGPDPTFTGPPNGQLTGPGQFTFQAKGETGVAYQWTLSANGATVDSKNDPPGTPATYSPPSSIFSQPGTYTLTLTATAGGGIASKQDSVQFVIQPSNPTPPQNRPTPQPPAATPGGVGSAPVALPAAPGLATGLHAVSYVPQLPNFSTPIPGALQPVTVIWLWRPDWFQPSSDPPRLVKTGGRPGALKRANVSLDPRGKGPSAAPLLAGLAAFGIFGAGWVMFKRRQVRSSLLD